MKTDTEKIMLFQSLFGGLTEVYGSYDPSTAKSFQVKAPVTQNVIKAHLKGKKPYGVYLLVQDRIQAIVVDFDTMNRLQSVEFIEQAKHYGLSSYIERSKSKGYHAWIFFNKSVLAFKARKVVCHIIDEIELPEIEVFPKHDSLGADKQYGNFINTPLFGQLVPRGKTVFVDPATFKPYHNQWGFLETVKKMDESMLDEIIVLNDLGDTPLKQPIKQKYYKKASGQYNLPVCAQRMLQNGVSKYQRVSCFRLAVHLKRVGLPYDMALAVLKTWALKNRPASKKDVIPEHYIIEQVSYAYSNNYRGYGCGSEAVAPFCIPTCFVHKRRKRINL